MVPAFDVTRAGVRQAAVNTYIFNNEKIMGRKRVFIEDYEQAEKIIEAVDVALKAADLLGAFRLLKFCINQIGKKNRYLEDKLRTILKGAKKLNVDLEALLEAEDKEEASVPPRQRSEYIRKRYIKQVT